MGQCSEFSGRGICSISLMAAMDNSVRCKNFPSMQEVSGSCTYLRSYTGDGKFTAIQEVSGSCTYLRSYNFPDRVCTFALILAMENSWPEQEVSGSRSFQSPENSRLCRNFPDRLYISRCQMVTMCVQKQIRAVSIPDDF